jgi:hypothetical protein
MGGIFDPLQLGGSEVDEVDLLRQSVRLPHAAGYLPTKDGV